MSGCSNLPVTREGLEDRLMACKARSLEGWEKGSILRKAALRTGLLVEGAEVLHLGESALNPDGSYRLSFRFSGASGSTVALGCAVPITPDGYYLTARHCLSRGDQILVTLVHDQGRVRWVQARPRIVWSGPD
ncbi:MAG: hypothetical protein AAF514_19010, partial [Verrucomicrobiota bacterium]